jgi:hypothetical protein
MASRGRGRSNRGWRPAVEQWELDQRWREAQQGMASSGTGRGGVGRGADRVAARGPRATGSAEGGARHRRPPGAGLAGVEENWAGRASGVASLGAGGRRPSRAMVVTGGGGRPTFIS